MEERKAGTDGWVLVLSPEPQNSVQTHHILSQVDSTTPAKENSEEFPEISVFLFTVFVLFCLFIYFCLQISFQDELLKYLADALE